MCQEENVVAVATLTPTDGKIVYKVGNEAKEKKITIKKIPHDNNDYGGELQIDNLLSGILSNSQAQISPSDAIAPSAPLLWYNDNYTYTLQCISES